MYPIAKNFGIIDLGKCKAERSRRRVSRASYPCRPSKRVKQKNPSEHLLSISSNHHRFCTNIIQIDLHSERISQFLFLYLHLVLYSLHILSLQAGPTLNSLSSSSGPTRLFQVCINCQLHASALPPLSALEEVGEQDLWHCMMRCGSQQLKLRVDEREHGIDRGPSYPSGAPRVATGAPNSCYRGVQKLRKPR